MSIEVFDHEVVLASLGTIAPILRVAAEIEHERPHVAYLCQCYAFEKAHRLDASSSGRGVSYFEPLVAYCDVAAGKDDDYLGAICDCKSIENCMYEAMNCHWSHSQLPLLIS